MLSAPVTTPPRRLPTWASRTFKSQVSRYFFGAKDLDFYRISTGSPAIGGSVWLVH